MCGIAGVFHRSGDKLDPDVLVRMTRSLVHRGPDGEGYFLNGPRLGSWLEAGDAVSVRACIEGGRGDVGLGHRRLSIIDLSTGQQPLANEDGTVWVTFNGEIYNFHSLVAELEAKGHRFRTRSDTEVIVHAWEECGDGTEMSAYWDLAVMETHTASAERMIEELLGRLEEATKLRMISDVPLGAFLSGGVDSSAVVAMMARASAQPVRTNSISFS